MDKYWLIFSLSLQNEFTYRLNFILWRLRNFFKIVMTYFLWQGIFITVETAFGYTPDQMTSYVLMVLIVSALVYSSPSSEIGGEIARGDLSNYLVKPFSYWKYWFTRDLASKTLNLIFVFFELFLLWLLFKPNFTIDMTATSLIGFITAVLIGILLYYFFNLTTRLLAFWTPENIWGVAFLTYVLIDLLGGSIFPLDILPNPIRIILDFTPFPYFIYYPISIFTGKTAGWEILQVLLQGAIWVGIMVLISKLIWQKGLRNYAAEGK